MSRYRRAPIPGATYFFTLNTYRRQRLLTDSEVLYALRQAMRSVRAEQLDAMTVLPDHLHAVWTLPLNDADYLTRWACLSAMYIPARAASARGTAIRVENEIELEE